MAKIFLAISILVTALTAGLGFFTKAKVDGLKQNLKTAQDGESVARAESSKARGELKKKDEELTAANKALDEQKSQLSTMETSLAAAKAEADKAAEAVRTSEQKVKELEEKLAAMPSTTNATTNADSPELTSARADLAKAQQELAEARQVQETLRIREAESAEKLASSEALVKRYREPMERAGIMGRVVAVNPGWNFVVLDVGDRRGATINAPLLVTRSGQVVAKLKITSVEPSTSIADVIPGSLARGESVQPGDRVVFSGRQAPPVLPAPADAAGTRPPNAQAQAR